MKTVFIIFALFVLSVSPALAQAPSAMNYQGIARDASGNLLQNAELSLRISILQGGAEGDAVYSEIHQVMTDRSGQFSLRLGKGRSSGTSFAMIDWHLDHHWLRVEMDETGGSDYALLGTSQLLTVPYAMYAVQAGSLAESDFNAKPSGLPSAVWHRVGNRGTSPSQDFVGTTDNADLVFRTNDVERVRFTATGDVGIGTSSPAAKLDVNGDVHIATDLDVDNDAEIGNDLDVGNDAAIGKDLAVANDATIGKDLDVGNNAHIGNNATIDGNAHIKGDTRIDGALDVSGKSTFGLFEVSAAGDLTFDPSADDGLNHVALFGNTNGNDADGIGIKISNGATDENNNFVTFYSGTANSAKITGRIEGYKYVPLKANAQFWSDNLKPAIEYWKLIGFNPNAGLSFKPDYFGLSLGSWPSISVSKTFSVSISGGSWPQPQWPSINPLTIANPKNWFNPNVSELVSKFEPLVCLAFENDWKSLLQMDVASLATFAARMELEAKCKDGGVTYGSKGADYAEWLPKADVSDDFIFGQIVGVKDGKISLTTDGADQVMSISMAPVVIGNIPPVSEEGNYEKVAFIGQVPVMVKGRVDAGDYIVASGRNDGFGFGVKPEDLTIEHLSRILGRALAASTNDNADMVNTLIGVKTNEWVHIFRNQEERIARLEAQVLEHSRTVAATQNNRMQSLEAENRELREEMRVIRTALGLPKSGDSPRQAKYVDHR